MIENHVVNLELSKKLREIGIEKKSIFYWMGEKIHSADNIIFENSIISKKGYYPAYLATELLELLPKTLESEEAFEKCRLVIDISNNNYITYIDDEGNEMYEMPSEEIKNESLADALAKMLIYLVENRLMEVEK